MRARFAMLVAWVATLPAQPGCVPDPCEQDALGCRDDAEFALAPDCELSGPLEVTLGQGVEDFEPLVAGEEPIVHDGVQGGHHLCLGLAIANPALDYPQVKVSFDAELYDEDWCDPADPACDPWVGSGERDLVLGPDLPVDEDGQVVQTGLILILSIWSSDLDRRIRLEVEDPCGRIGTAEHMIPAS
jgi:hypothetical protein